MKKSNIKKRLSYNASLLIICISAVISLLPIIFILANSFMGSSEAAARYTSSVTPYNIHETVSDNIHYINMGFLPFLISTSAWREILINDPIYLRYIWNSLALTIPIVLGQLVIAPLAAYAFERAKSKFKELLFFAYIIIMLLPMQALLVPHFIAANFLNINYTYLAIILPAIFAPFGVFLIRQQMRGFNNYMIEAAKIDGANEMIVLLCIVLPNIKPTLTALTVLAFAEAWNIVDQAVIFIRDPFAMPLSVHLSTGLSGNMGIVFALSSLLMIPALIVFIYGQDRLGEGFGYSDGK